MNRYLNIAILCILGLLITSCMPEARFTSKSTFHSPAFSNEIKSNKIGKQTPSSPKADIDNILASTSDLSFKRKEIINFAESWLGTPYCYGGENKKCTDCSGFVMEVYEMAGIKIPRTAAMQYEFGKEIGDNDMLPGDLVFFIRNNKIGHVGIYVGDNEFIHASSSHGVTLQNLNDQYYYDTFAGFRRLM